MPRIVYCSAARAPRCNIHCKLRLDKTLWTPAIFTLPPPSSSSSFPFPSFSSITLSPLPAELAKLSVAELFIILRGPCTNAGRNFVYKEHHFFFPANFFHSSSPARFPPVLPAIVEEQAGKMRRLCRRRSYFGSGPAETTNSSVRVLFSSLIEPEAPGIE